MQPGCLLERPAPCPSLHEFLKRGQGSPIHESLEIESNKEADLWLRSVDLLLTIHIFVEPAFVIEVAAHQLHTVDYELL